MATRKPTAAESLAAKELAAQEMATAQMYALQFDDDDISAETLNPALETLYAEMGLTDGGEATVHVSKIDADGRGGEANIWKGEPDNYDLEMLAKKFGSGSYRVKVYVRIPTGQKVIKANKVFTWLLSPDDEAKRNAPQQAAPVDMPATIARIVAESMRAYMPQLTQQTPQVDPLLQLKGLAEVFHTMMPNGAQVQQQAPDQLGMIKSVIELTNMMKGEQTPLESGTNANTNDLLLGLITKFGPLLAGAMQQPGAQMGAIPQAAPVAQIINTQPQPAQPAPIAEDTAVLQLRMGLNFLIGQCETGGAPETYAEVVLDSVPIESMQQLLNGPDPVGQLAAVDPRVKLHEAWFEAMIAECRELLKPEPDQQIQEVK